MVGYLMLTAVRDRLPYIDVMISTSLVVQLLRQGQMESLHTEHLLGQPDDVQRQIGVGDLDLNGIDDLS